MKIAIDRHDDASLKVTASVEPIDYLEKYNETLKKLRKEAVLPGFRPGTVPVNLLKSRFGKQVMWDTLSELAMSNIFYALREKGIPHVGNPLVDSSIYEQIDPNTERSYEFISYVGYIPNFDLSLEELGTVNRYNITYGPDDIEMEIRNWQARLGTAQPVEEINLLDKFYEVALSIKAVDTFNNLIPVENNENATYEEVIANEMDGLFRSWLASGFNQVFFNKRKGEKYRMTMQDFAEGSVNPFADPNIPPRTKELFENNSILMEITEIYEITPHPLNRDLYRKVFGDNTTVKNELEFREEFAEAFEGHVAQMSDQRLKYEIDRQVLSKQKVTLPVNILAQNFLDEYKRTNNITKESEINQEHFNYNLNIYLMNVQKMAVFNQIVNDFPEVEVNETAFHDFLKDGIRSIYFDGSPEAEMAKNTLLKAKDDTLHPDIANSPDDDEQEEGDDIMADSNDMYLEMMVDNLVNSKDYDYQRNFNGFAENRILTFLIENKLKVEDKEITYKDFGKLSA